MGRRNGPLDRAMRELQVALAEETPGRVRRAWDDIQAAAQAGQAGPARGRAMGIRRARLRSRSRN